MATGHVKWFNIDKGYGFIQPDDGSDDKFVHHSGWREGAPRSLRPSDLEGKRVEYDLEQGPKGIQCCDVVLVENAPAA